MDRVNPWDRLPGENANQFAAFECYMMLGPGRTLPAAWYKYRSEHHGDEKPNDEPSSTIRRWYKDHRWVERATAWDDHLAKARRREQEKAVAKEARKRSIDTESLIWDTAEFLKESLPLVQMQFMQKLTEEGENGPTATQTNQAMRVMTDQIRMVNELAKGQGLTQGNKTDDDSTESDHVEALLKDIASSGEEEGS